MSKKISCGILLHKKNGSILLGHATGMNHWDIFKGVQEIGESYAETAIRETQEECGLLIKEENLIFHGHFKYMKGKDLVIFSAVIDEISLDDLHCSTFVNIEGRQPFPEIDKYNYFSKDEFLDVSSRSLYHLFSKNNILKNL